MEIGRFHAKGIVTENLGPGGGIGEGGGVFVVMLCGDEVGFARCVGFWVLGGAFWVFGILSFGRGFGREGP